MWSSGSGPPDCGTGPIVWVRRRNGSWWPGKILGPDELAECNLSSPRTGTPVKLLGREDASVDWYNLEKSKRVKAFRCGEFDDCIERAEAAQGMPIKKREKYARREDAILHALELEKQLLKKQGKLVGTSEQPRSKSSASAKKGPDVNSEGLANNNSIVGNVKLNHHLNRADSVIEAETVASSVCTKEGNQLISEDDHSEATARMRGLQDFGLRTSPLKRKLSSSADSDGSEKPLVDIDIQAQPVGTPSMERTNHENGVEQTGAVCQGKRSKCIYFPSDSNESLDDKELPTNQNKMFCSQLEDDDSHTHHASLNEQNSPSGFMEDVESDSSKTDSSDSESDSSRTEPDDEMTNFPDAAMSSEAEGDALTQPQALGEHGSTSSEYTDELAFSGEMHHFYPEEPSHANEAVSKWQLKGKRNVRHLTKKFVDEADGKVLNGPLRGSYHGIKGSTFDPRAYGFDDVDSGRKYLRTQIHGLDNGRYPYAPRFLSKGRYSTDHNLVDSREAICEDHPALKGRWEERAEFSPIIHGRHHFGGRPRSVLIDVDLKVQASYQKEPVPIISLTSKLDGKAIIGHPIQIEALEDGSSETLVPINDYRGIEAVDHYGNNTSLPPAWRTARRTNFRIPRPHLSSTLASENAAEDPIYTDQERRFLSKNPNAGSYSHKARVVQKSLPHTSRPPMDRKFVKKLPKKASLTSNQKTRTLSSIGFQQTFRVKHVHYTTGGQMDGLIKPETSGPTTVACIPIKLVFSRLLEKINRPPSKAA